MYWPALHLALQVTHVMSPVTPPVHEPETYSPALHILQGRHFTTSVDVCPEHVPSLYVPAGQKDVHWHKASLGKCVYVYLYHSIAEAWISVCVYICMYVCIGVCVCVCMNVCVHSRL
jgi:hypothetical protein